MGHNTQFAGPRAADRLSAPPGETLLPFPPQPENITERARGQEGRRGVGGWVRASCADTQINTNCIKHTKELQGFCPWSPPRGGARDQSSLRAGACRPREKRARSITGRDPAFDLDHALPYAPELCCALPSHQKLQKLCEWGEEDSGGHVL